MVQNSQDQFRIVGKDLEESEKIYKPSMTYWQDAVRRFKSNKVIMFFFSIFH